MKALVLFSGGLDSSTCLGLAVARYGKSNVIALSLHYGQKHKKELKSAENIARYYEVKRIQFDIGELFKKSGCSLLSHSSSDIPLESYAKQLMKTNGEPVSTYVPYRNGLFLSIAASVALSEKCDVIYYGAHADDAAGNAYPDCSTEFNEAISKAITQGSGGKLFVKAPFIEKNKGQVVEMGLRLKVPYEMTWSCYKGEEKPCGKCGTCIDRIKAFEINGIKDPLTY